MVDVLLHEDARDELRDLPPDVQDRIREKLENAASDPGRYLKSLSGRETYRLRIGEYRVEMEWDRATGELRVLAIGHRDGFYE